MHHTVSVMMGNLAIAQGKAGCGSPTRAADNPP